MKNEIRYTIIGLVIFVLFIGYNVYKESTKIKLPLTLEERININPLYEEITKENILQAMCELREVEAIKIAYPIETNVIFLNLFQEQASKKNGIITSSLNPDFEEVKRFNINVNLNQMHSFMTTLRIFNSSKFSLFIDKKYPYVSISTYNDGKEKIRISIGFAKGRKKLFDSINPDYILYMDNIEVNEYKAIKRKYPFEI